MKQPCKCDKGATSCRASGLNRADDGSWFNANDWDVDDADYGLLEIFQYAGIFFKMQRDLWQVCKDGEDTQFGPILTSLKKN